MALEFELKYRATPGLLEQIAAAYPGEYRVIPMTTRYYDTPAGALSARRWTLRCRREGEEQVCTLKTPAGLGRGEWEIPSDDIHRALPALAQAAELPELLELANQGLVWVCGAEFTRRALDLTLDGCTAELALDAGVLRNGAKEYPLAEVELELKAGEPGRLAAFGAGFSRRFGLEPEEKSKFARAKMLGMEE